MFCTFSSRLGEKLKAKTGQYFHIQRDDNIDKYLPDRIVNPDMYQPLLAATDSGENSQSESQSWQPMVQSTV